MHLAYPYAKLVLQAKQSVKQQLVGMTKLRIFQLAKNAYDRRPPTMVVTACTVMGHQLSMNSNA
jgi:hypothetical protein